MSQLEYFLLTRVLLQFDRRSDDIVSDISSATFSDDGSLWVGSDEMVGVERLSPIGCHSYGKHQRFLLKDYIDLFDDDEIDIEGMDFKNGYLWLTGSHSTKRKKPKGKDLETDLERLATVTTDLNRFILARIPVVNGELIKSCVLAEGESKTAACLQKIDRRNLLFEVLKSDAHLKRFITSGIPSKDNGLDIEGLAIANNNRIFLGLRGPVLRGWAIILEIQLTESEPGVLTLEEITDEGAKYKKHFLDLNGLGIRELCLQGEDLIILAGPTMAVEGEMQVFRWKDIFNHSGNNIHLQDDNLFPLFDLPFTIGSDHAEGLALYSCWGEQNSLMIFYDSPDSSRLREDKRILVDVFQIKSQK
ncbi:Protein of unknown function (DUF3616) [Rivularia sp. PCC 7116]|uniref:DUF3616 domain-containing protein n=1 Tax=Rivularia sp. PCC 7116 TaxID=373994 RepID=UPI00029EF260|nr:DUF3616 domain-containing protein [Rivularia sp. PCC 7116]AFY57951.1 Protein of unknown function (DUF3616) [Rivularia sp. PCC 7116]